MENGRVHQYASKRLTAWSRQSLPGWWTMLTVVIGVGFFLYLAHSMISTDNEPAPTLPPLSERPQPPGGATPTAPAATPPAPAEPSVPATGAVVRVPGPAGSLVSAPKQAVEVARLAFAALYDPDAAAQVPTSDGSPLRAPMQASAGRVSEVTRVSAGDASADRLQFSALVDPDGPAGTLRPTTAYVVVARLDSGWVFLNTAG